MIVSDIERTKLAATGDEYHALITSDARWFVRTADDLHQLRAERKDEGLARLSDAAFDNFVASCKFHNGGLAGRNVRYLTAELGLKSTFAVFNRFGADDILILSWQEQACDPETHHCSWDFWEFCSEITCRPIVVAPGL